MKRVLFCLHLPPPIHGSSVVGGQIYGSSKIRDVFETSWINLLASERVSDSGSVSFKKVLGALGVLAKTVGAVVSKRPDLCYFALTVFGPAFFRDLLLVAILKFFRVPLVFHLHNKGFSRVKHPLRVFLYRFVFDHAKVILLSQRLYPDVQRWVSQSDVFICPNGIDFGAPKVSTGNPVQGPVQVLFLSNLIESKGVWVLLEACKILKSRGVVLRCQMVGGEGDIRALELVARIEAEGLGDCVVYLGRKTGEEKQKLFTWSDVFVFPTFYPMECFPLVLVEAMASALPCISTEEGGIPDLVLDGITGLIVERRSAVDLADKLERLISDPDLRMKMGLDGRKHYEARFTGACFENRIFEILESCLGSRGCSSRRET
jgi:glycosyltransferase involved in cell wall biosynthesis